MAGVPQGRARERQMPIPVRYRPQRERRRYDMPISVRAANETASVRCDASAAAGVDVRSRASAAR
jgi:hypothetical protein